MVKFAPAGTAWLQKFAASLSGAEKEKVAALLAPPKAEPKVEPPSVQARV